MLIVDIGTPSQLRLLAAVDLGGSALDVVIAGHLAYVANLRSGLQMVDLSDAGNPRLQATLAIPGNPYALVVEDGIVYLAAANGGLQIVNARDPQNPFLLASLPTPEPAFGLALRDKVAFIGAGRAGLLCIDVHIPQSPKRIGGADTPGTARGVVLAGELALVTDTHDGLQVIDIADPRHPFAVGTYELPGLVHAVTLWQNRALVAAGRNGLHIIDLQQPASRNQIPAGDDPLPSPVEAKKRFFISGNEVLEISTEVIPPRCIARITINGKGRALQTAGNFLYVLSVGQRQQEQTDDPRQIEVIDISDAQNPRSVQVPQSLHAPMDLLVVGSTLWVTGKDGLCRFALTDPESPRLGGCLPLPSAGTSLAQKDGLVLVGDRQGNLYVIDTAVPESPRLVGTAVLPWHLQAFADATKIVVDGSLALVAGGRNGLLIYSIDDPQHPQLIGGRQLPDGNHATGLTVSGRIAYVSDIRSGVHLFDFSNPRQLQLLATTGHRGESRHFVIAGEQIVSATQEGVKSFPLPMELAGIALEGGSQIRAKIPASIPSGNYTLWVSNPHRRHELPGALRIDERQN